VKEMKNYWLRRVAGSFLVLLVVLILNFLLFRLMPGDPVASILDPRFSPEAKAELQRLYGLDKPLSFQFLLYMKQMVPSMA
jgi:peptide/nickel transport system permease protein